MDKKTIYRVLTIAMPVLILVDMLLLKKQVFGPTASLVICTAVLLAAVGVTIFAEQKLKKMNEAERKEENEVLSENIEEQRAALFVEGFPSDRLYFVYVTQMYYAFSYFGNASFGVREDLVPERVLTDGDRLHAGPKDIWIAKSEITEGKLKMKRCISTQLPSCASLKLRTQDGKKYSFIILQELNEQAIRGFFADVEKRIV